MTSTWTPEREAEARRLWTEGQSAAHIARHLGGVTRLAVIGKIHRMGLGRETASEVSARAKAKPKPKPGRRMICAVQGCGRELSKKNMSAVCKDHAHVPGRCKCPVCQGITGPRRKEVVDREGVRVAEVPYPTSNSGVVLKARVSLVREPWLRGA